MKSIIFDLGVVLLEVEYDKTVEAFGALGLANPAEAFSKESQGELFREFERGRTSENDFLNALSQRMGGVAHDKIRNAWCAMLGDLPLSKFELLEDLSGKYDLYILSNTNEIHRRYFEKTVEGQHGWSNFQKLFKYIGYSHEMGCRKPENKIFEMLIEECKIDVHGTLFVDDTKANVEAAKGIGIPSVHYHAGNNLRELLSQATVNL